MKMGGIMPYDSAFGQMMSNIFGWFDLSIFRAFGAIQNDIFTFFANVFTCLGDLTFVIMFGFTACVLVLFKRSRKVGLLIILSLGLYILVNDLLFKYIFLRIRPYNALQGNAEFFSWYMNVGPTYDSPYCFPSGHTCCTFAVSTAMFFWIKNDMKKSECWMIFFIPVFVGLSRIYLMVHYPTDVIAGMFEGIIIGIATWYLIELFFRILKYFPKCIRQLNDIDLEPWLSKKLGRKLEAKNVALVVVLILICFCVTTFSKESLTAPHLQKCEHEGPDFICMNEGKYQRLDEQTGQYHFYCEQHEEELER